MNRFENFDPYIQEAMRSWSCPGVALAVVKGDEVIHQAVFGLRDVENQLPLTPDTRFAMASVTKSFTALSVALLVDEGKLDWDKPVREYMPEFILADAYVTQHVTVRDMLSHRTGLPRHDLAAWRLDISRAEFIKRMKHLKFSATFREKFQYNNLMYYAAAYLVEKIAQQKWEDFMQARVFGPLGMSASNFRPEPPQAGQHTAKGYRVDRDQDGGAKGLINMPFGKHTELSPGAAGALFSTLADLIQWLKMHVNQGQVGDLRLVSAANLKQNHLPQTVVPAGGYQEALMGTAISTYGMGWFIEPYQGSTIIQHDGGVEGHTLIIGALPAEKIGVVVLTNIANLPLPHVLMYECIDRAMNLPEQDWNKKFHEIYDPFIVGEAKSKLTSAEEKVAAAPPTHPLETYLGQFKADGYPDFAVRRNGEQLQACSVGSLDWSTFRHYHYDVFEWYLSDFDAWVKVRYLTNDQGDLDSISLPMEPSVENLVFTRTQPELDAGLTAALLGVYHTSVEGLAFTISAHEGKFYVIQSGGAPQEIKPYKVSAEWVGFRLKQNRFDFERGAQGIQRLVLKTPDMTLEAVRK